MTREDWLAIINSPPPRLALEAAFDDMVDLCEQLKAVSRKMRRNIDALRRALYLQDRHSRVKGPII